MERREGSRRCGGNGNREPGVDQMQGSNNGSRREAGPAGAAADQEVREQDQYMPIANVIRIMRRILPAHAKISDDAKETIQECVSEYISFITGEANDRCQREQRKTITAEDVIWAMSKLGFDDYVEPLTLFLSRHRTDSNSDDMLLHHATRLHHRPPPAHAYAHPLPPLPPNGGAGGYMDQYHLHGQPGNFGYPASQEHQYPAALMHPRGGGGGNTGASSSRGNEGNGFDPYGRFNN